MRCDIVAEYVAVSKVSHDPHAHAALLALRRGIIEATKQLGLKIPLVVRLQGTKVEEGKEYVSLCLFSSLFQKFMCHLFFSLFSLINKSGLKIFAFDGLDEGALFFGFFFFLSGGRPGLYLILTSATRLQQLPMLPSTRLV